MWTLSSEMKCGESQRQARFYLEAGRRVKHFAIFDYGFAYVRGYDATSVTDEFGLRNTFVPGVSAPATAIYSRAGSGWSREIARWQSH